MRFYIYCFRDGAEIIYIGKGTGRRVNSQSKRFGFEGEILERMDDEEQAYAREKYWISQLQPTQNKNGGGGGGFVEVNPIPLALRGKISLKEWGRALKEAQAEAAEIELIGSRRYVARLLTRKVDETNCDQFGLSKVDVCRLREVANGPRC